MREQTARGLFSILAAAVFLMTAAEWWLWGWEQRKYWKLIPSVFLAGMAVFEASIVWKRVDRILRDYV